MVDITERMETEARLRQAQERLQACGSHMPAVVYVESDRQRARRSCTSAPTVEQVFGYTAEEWTWTPDFWVDRVHPDDREAIRA